MITRENYEEFFLLYTDNELSVQDRQAVESFVADNTDLQEELNNLLQCRIKPEDHFVFANKSSLLKQDSLPADQAFSPHAGNQAFSPHAGNQAFSPHAGNQVFSPHAGNQAFPPHDGDQAFSLNDGNQAFSLHDDNQPISLHDDNYEVYFLNYTDGELDEAGRQAVEDYASANPPRLRELQLMQQTVFVPDLAIVFEKKETLYRKEVKRRVMLMPWLRAAAAAAILLATGLYLFNTRKSETPASRIAGNITGSNKVTTEPLNGQTAGPGEAGDIKNHASPVTDPTTDTLYHQRLDSQGIDNQDQVHQGQDRLAQVHQRQDQDHRNRTTNGPAGMNKPNHPASDLTANNNTRQQPGEPDDRTTARGDNLTNRPKHTDAISNGTELANAGSDQQQQPTKVSIKPDITGVQNNHAADQIAIREGSKDGARDGARDLRAQQGNHLPAEGGQQKGDGQGSISRENSSFATQALLNSENNSTDDGYASEEPASPKKNKLRGIFRRVTRVFEKTTNVDDEKHGVLIGSFQFALK